MPAPVNLFRFAVVRSGIAAYTPGQENGTFASPAGPAAGKGEAAVKWLYSALAFICVLCLVDVAGSGLRAGPGQSPAGRPPMSLPPGAPVSAPRCDRTPMIRAGVTLSGLGTRLAQSDVGEWCTEDKYCRSGRFCCGNGCCGDGTVCCARDGGCCPSNLPIGCGPRCYASEADAEADGCSNREVCAAPAR